MLRLAAARVLVTGGAGAIGSHVVRTLQARGALVTVVDDLSSGRLANLPLNIVFYRLSIRDPKVARLVDASDVVIHLAAKFANQNSIDHPVDDVLVNAVGTLELLELCRGRGIRFVYASTSCVTQLRTPYAISKKTGEEYVRFYGDVHGLPVNVVRYFNSYGPFDYPGRYRSVIPNFLDLALRGAPLTVMGTGDETRDFTYVGDVAEATVRAAEVDAVGHVIDVGAGQPVTVLALAEAVNHVTRNRAGVTFQPRRSWDTVTDRKADVTTARAVLGYVPATPLGDGLALAADWLREQVLVV